MSITGMNGGKKKKKAEWGKEDEQNRKESIKLKWQRNKYNKQK